MELRYPLVSLPFLWTAQLPNLRTLILSNNRLTNLSDLDPLAYLRKLETLSLLDNVVAKKPKYRLYVINLLPKLRILDFRKVKPKVLHPSLHSSGNDSCSLVA